MDDGYCDYRGRVVRRNKKRDVSIYCFKGGCSAGGGGKWEARTIYNSLALWHHSHAYMCISTTSELQQGGEKNCSFLNLLAWIYSIFLLGQPLYSLTNEKKERPWWSLELLLPFLSQSTKGCHWLIFLLLRLHYIMPHTTPCRNPLGNRPIPSIFSILGALI